ncbi:MAG: adenosine kinase [Hyphomicrobium sp.]|nr:adenosine kinase [Hyphomicrobium sp.]
MTAAHYDVIAIGNAIVDIIGRCDDAFLKKHGASKGHMTIVGPDVVQRLYDDMGPAIEISGGSAANTVVGLASFGSRAAFIGKVADDEFGRIFRHDITASGVTYKTDPVSGKDPTSRSLILVTPDGERTMHTYLGISTDLDQGEVAPDMIAASAIVYLEGYLFDRPEAKAAFRQAVAIANAAGRKVALTLSDGFCVDRHRAEFLDLIRNGVDILFANESEITSLYETPSFDDAARQAAEDCTLAVLTRSAKGSLILGSGAAVTVTASPIETVVDTTGAGDLYAAGFLHGLAQGTDLETAGHLGSLAAAEIISHIGARPEANLRDLAEKNGLIS